MISDEWSPHFIGSSVPCSIVHLFPFTFAAVLNSLSIWLYNLSIRLYVLGVWIASTGNEKARAWISGRERLFEELESKIGGADRVIWMHCASAGEFEQGKPVIEALKEQYPNHKILVSFFSPSGFAVAKKYKYADIITYLPADTRKNARRFVELVHPELVVFVKYEFWYHHLSAVAFKHIPLFLVSGIFRKEQAFFKWYGTFYRQLLFLFRHLFVQDQQSLDLLEAHQIRHCSIGGDTRFDRVKKIAGNFTPLENIQRFAGDSQVIVAGSTWSNDENLLAACIQNSGAKWIIAPHEIDAAHLERIGDLFPNAVRYSKLETMKHNDFSVLIIDNIGLLSRLYHYATISYIGGGFNKSGIHNTLEAAVYGKPVIFGPNYQKFKEAKDLIAGGGAFSIKNEGELARKMDHLLNDPEQLARSGASAENYVAQHVGATEKFLRFIQENRLLTK